MTAAGGTGLLERALAYCLGAVEAVTPALLPRPTPCGNWDLRGLLHHLNGSLAALYGRHSLKLAPTNPLVFAVAMAALAIVVAWGRYGLVA